MSQNELLILNGTLVTLVVLSYVFIRRKPRDPVKLNLHSKDRPKSTVPAEVSASQGPTTAAGATPRSGIRPKNSREKSLNVPFDFAGQSLDAYEVLELPAGSSVAAARKAYDALTRVAAPEQRALFQAALQSILTSQN